MDFLLIGLIVHSVQFSHQAINGNPLIWFLIYNFIVIICGGKSLGKYCFSLSIKSEKRGFKNKILLISREILIVILLPILMFNFLLVASLPLHDRISGTKVTKNEF